MKGLISKILSGESLCSVPVWFMRQAGRYLPEYHQQFSKKSDFLEVCYDSDIASEITLQPVERFGLDAAIIFADILLLPHSLGCEVKFVKEVGPIIKPVGTDFVWNENFLDILSPIFETVKKVRKRLPDDKSVIGFAGSPWTVVAYMLEGKTSSNFIQARTWAYKNKKEFSKIINIVTESTIEYLKKQLDSGADVIQLFDSWAGSLSVGEFYSWVIEPTRKIVDEVGGNIIGFPKGAGVLYKDYVESTGIKVVSIDYSIPLEWARDQLQTHVILQGNLNPMLLAYDIEGALNELSRIFDVIGKKPFIFNLGHGIIKDTPVHNVEKLVNEIRNINKHRINK